MKTNQVGMCDYGDRRERMQWIEETLELEWVQQQMLKEAEVSEFMRQRMAERSKAKD